MQSSAVYHGGAGPCNAGTYCVELPDGSVQRVVQIHTEELRPWTSGSPTTEADVAINGVDYHVQQFGATDCGCHGSLHFENWDTAGVSPQVVMALVSPGGAAQFTFGVCVKFYDSDDALAGFSCFGNKQNFTAVGVANDVQMLRWAAGGTLPGLTGNLGADRFATLKIQRFATDPWDTFAGTLQLLHAAVIYPLT